MVSVNASRAYGWTQETIRVVSALEMFRSCLLLRKDEASDDLYVPFCQINSMQTQKKQQQWVNFFFLSKSSKIFQKCSHQLQH